MTLIMTLIRPGEGAWICTDNLMTDGRGREDLDLRKYVPVRCGDGSVFLAFSGMAELRPGGRQMADYIRTTLRGEHRTVEGYLQFLQQRLNRDAGRIFPSATPLMVTGTAYRGGGGPQQTDPDALGVPWHYEITNLRKLPNGSVGVGPDFTWNGWMIEVPHFFAHGSGAEKLSAADRASIERALHHRPRRSEDYLGLLASINRRVAEVEGSGVTRWCQTSFMRASGFFGASQDFREGQPPVDNEVRPTPFMLFGLDTTEISMVLVRQLRLMTEGGADEADFKARTDAASKRMIRGRP